MWDHRPEGDLHHREPQRRNIGHKLAGLAGSLGFAVASAKISRPEPALLANDGPIGTEHPEYAELLVEIETALKVDRPRDR